MLLKAVRSVWKEVTGVAPKCYSVMGYPECPFFGQAVKLASELQDKNPHVKVSVKEFSRNDFLNHLPKVQQVSMALSCIFVFMVQFFFFFFFLFFWYC